MHRTARLPFRFVVCLALGAGLGSQPATALGGTVYELADASSYQEGCFDPCMCPIMMNDTLEGHFVLDRLSNAGGVAVYDVSDVAWRFTRGGQTIHVTGSGQFRINPASQRIVLDLQVGEDAVQRFDSGVVPLRLEFPLISIAAAINGFFCYDHAFDLVAAPLAVGTQTESWGLLKSRYR